MPMRFSFCCCCSCYVVFLIFLQSRDSRTSDINRSILVHFLLTDLSVYLNTSRSAVPLEKMTEPFFITIGTQEFR